MCKATLQTKHKRFHYVIFHTFLYLPFVHILKTFVYCIFVLTGKPVFWMWDHFRTRAVCSYKCPLLSAPLHRQFYIRVVFDFHEWFLGKGEHCIIWILVSMSWHSLHYNVWCSTKAGNKSRKQNFASIFQGTGLYPSCTLLLNCQICLQPFFAIVSTCLITLH